MKKLFKKAFSVSVVALTIMWSMGLAALVPTVVNAVDCPTVTAGAVIKVTPPAGTPKAQLADYSTMWFVTSDLKKAAFTNGDVFKTWYDNYKPANRVDLPKGCQDNYADAGYVHFYPGTLVKSPASDQLYVVESGNKKTPVTTDVAKAVYGDTYSVKSYNDFFMAALTTGTKVETAKLFDGMLVKKTGGDVYQVSGGNLKKVDGTLTTSVAKNVVTASATLFDATEKLDTTVTAASTYADPAQSTGTGTGTGTGTTQTGGALTVALAADTPVSATIADGTTYNNMVKVSLTAGSTAVKVKGVTVLRTGLFANANVTGVSVWDKDGARHGDVMTSFNSDNTVVIGFGTNPILVAAGTTETLTVAFNIGSDANSGTVGAAVKALDSDASSVTGSLPVNGNTMSVADGSASVSGVTVAAVGVGGNFLTTDSANVEIGQTKEIAKFRFTESSGYNDITVKKLTFYLEGTLKEKDLKNFTVVSPIGEVLGTTEWMSDRYVTVNLTKPYTVAKSQNRTLTLKATVNDGSGNYFRVHLQNDYDVMVMDAALGYYVLPSDGAGSWDGVKDVSTGYFKMKSGTLTLAKANDSLSGNISAGATGLVLAKFNVTAVGEDMEIRKIGIKIATSTNALILNGNVILRSGNDTLLTFSGGYSADLYVNGSQRSLSQYLYVKSGETKTLEVVADIMTTAAANDTYKVYIGNFYAKRMSTLDYSDNVPAATYSTDANTLTVQTTSMAFVKDTSMGNATVAAGSDKLLGQYIVKAGNSEAVKLTNVTIKFAGTANVPTQLQNLTLWAGGTQLGTTISTVATSSNSFTFELPLAKNEAKTLKLTASVVSGASGNVSSTVDAYTYFGTDTSNTTSEITDVVGQDITFGSANVILTAVTDATTISKIYGSGVSQQLGKWKLAAENENVVLQKITFTLKNQAGNTVTDSGNFGTLYLYDSSNMATPLATGAYVPGTGNGYVQFSGFELPVTASGYKYLVLKGDVNASGTLTSGSMNAFVVTADTASYMEAYAAGGAALTSDQIDFAASQGASGDQTNQVTSTLYRYQDAVVAVAPVNLSGSLELGATTPIFKYTVTNNGTVDMRFTSTTVVISQSGLTSSGGSATGTIKTWGLYEANEAGGLGTQLAVNTAVGLAGGAGVPEHTAASSIGVDFNTGNDVNNLLDSFIIAPGSTRTFIVTANTNNIFDGKSTGTVNVSGSITGSTGYNSSGAAWYTGNFQYAYTPVGASELTSKTELDSYNVNGNTLSRSL